MVKTISWSWKTEVFWTNEIACQMLLTEQNVFIHLLRNRIISLHSKILKWNAIAKFNKGGKKSNQFKLQNSSYQFLI